MHRRRTPNVFRRKRIAFRKLFQRVECISQRSGRATNVLPITPDQQWSSSSKQEQQSYNYRQALWYVPFWRHVVQTFKRLQYKRKRYISNTDLFAKVHSIFSRRKDYLLNFCKRDYSCVQASVFFSDKDDFFDILSTTRQ